MSEPNDDTPEFEAYKRNRDRWNPPFSIYIVHHVDGSFTKYDDDDNPSEFDANGILKGTEGSS